ncbi:hypothetical protein SCLCIDRAFT_18086 [Scleroderma citrinum Foug A]|uniref:Uncharacterized protein n=1 Tax=Scleroderma citrinum Foug A TaxID=1036808 RepID=A0A0C3D9F2_9AGAM|nr:hypothetical protein SCLCIDRAFT_18086 [Scleroderma citrinum Foug A]
MSILYYDPFTEFDRLFDDAFATRFLPTTTLETTEGGRSGRAISIRLDLHENKESNTVTAIFELPGVKQGDVNIDVHQNRLTISGEFKSEFAPDDPGYVVKERPHDKFSRSINLPAGVKPEDVKAKLENGVLTIAFPKVTPEQEPKRITVS